MSPSRNFPSICGSGPRPSSSRSKSASCRMLVARPVPTLNTSRRSRRRARGRADWRRRCRCTWMKSRVCRPSSKIKRRVVVEERAGEDRRGARVGIRERLARAVDVEEAQRDRGDAVGVARSRGTSPRDRAWSPRRSRSAPAACLPAWRSAPPSARQRGQSISQLPCAHLRVASAGSGDTGAARRAPVAPSP